MLLQPPVVQVSPGRALFELVVERFVLVSRMVFAGAVPLMAWAAGIVFLLVPAQTTDLLAQSTPLQRFAYFPAAVGLWAFTCWFWTRWGVNLQPLNWPEKALDDNPALKHALVRPRDVVGTGRMLRLWIPRLPLLGSLPIAFISCCRNEAVLSSGWWYSTLPLGLEFAAAECLFWWVAIHQPHTWFVTVPADTGRPAAAGLPAPGSRPATRNVPPGRHPTAKPLRTVQRLAEGAVSRLNDLRPVTRVSRSQGTFDAVTCLDRLPLGRWSFLLWLGAFAGIAVALSLAPVVPAHVLGAPATTFICLAAATGFVAFPSVLIRRVTGLPGTLVLCVWVALVTQVNGSHHIRTIERDTADIDLQPPGGNPSDAIVAYPLPGQRPLLGTALDAWLGACNQGNDMADIVLVATAGGASRAALWTASALRTIEQSVGEMPFRRALFAISGVSGGSLGAAAYVAALPPGGCAVETDGANSQERWENERQALRTEFLSPPLAGYLSTDVLASFLPLPVQDRAAALEMAWELAWSDTWKLAPPPAEPPPAVPAGALHRSFLSLWMLGGRPQAAEPGPGKAWKAGLPLLFFNGTHAKSGFPIITAPVKITRDAFPLALDLLDIVGRDIRLSTAVTNSARFPVVSPGGVLVDRQGDYKGYVMDGGYVENYGADTVRDLLRDIDASKTLPKSVCPARVPPGADPPSRVKCGPRVAVIQISSDPSLSAELLSRCGDAPKVALSPDRVAAPVQILDDVLGPLFTVVEARGARGARTAGDLMRAKCPKPGTKESKENPFEYFHFGLCDEDIPGKGRQGNVIGLNWALTDPAADFLAPQHVTAWADKDAPAAQQPDRREPSAMEACGNLDELRRLVEWFGNATSR